jgi:LPXTG-motif cell wall-anchored protein
MRVGRRTRLGAMGAAALVGVSAVVAGASPAMAGGGSNDSNWANVAVQKVDAETSAPLAGAWIEVTVTWPEVSFTNFNPRWTVPGASSDLLPALGATYTVPNVGMPVTVLESGSGLNVVDAVSPSGLPDFTGQIQLLSEDPQDYIDHGLLNGNPAELWSDEAVAVNPILTRWSEQSARNAAAGAPLAVEESGEFSYTWTVVTGADGLAWLPPLAVPSAMDGVEISAVEVRAPEGYQLSTTPVSTLYIPDYDDIVASPRMNRTASISANFLGDIAPVVTLTNVRIPDVVLGSSASDQADGDKVLTAAGGTVVDVVSYENLTPGAEYTVRGGLMDKATGAGTGITGETVFTPASANGTVDVLFDVPAGFAGTTLVAFEQLHDSIGAIVATHEDINDAAQTVTVEEIVLTPVLGSSASDQADGDKVLPAAGGTVVDVVSYGNLIPGAEYTVRGELMDKATGEGTGITGETVFTPASANGTVDVLFDVPAGFHGKTLVAFERLHDAADVVVATHEDIDDAAQTVTVEKPVVPPTTPPSGHLAQTGSDFNPAFPFVAGAIALAIGAALLIWLRRRRVVAE